MKFPPLKPWMTKSLLAAGCVVIGGGIGYFLPHPPASSVLAVTRIGGYSFINPLLNCHIEGGTPAPEFDHLQGSLNAVIDAAKSHGDVTRAAVYFRSMDSGDWTGVDQSDTYVPASLLKVPVLIAYLRESEDEPGILDRMYALPAAPDENANEYFKPPEPLALGRSYSVDTLLRAMAVESDNNAEFALTAHVATSSLENVYNDFNLPMAADSASDAMSPAAYMRVFRILYNATYLTRADSQEVLATLAQSTFADGAAAGLPAGTPFSHKFGERDVTTENASGAVTGEVKDLSDCGIVYYPQHPYGICVMTEGTDYAKQASVIADLSRIAYQAVDGGLLK